MTKKYGSINRKRVQTLFRLWDTDVTKLKAKLILDGTTLQRMMEMLIKEYFKNNPAIMSLIQRYAQEKDPRKRRGTVDEFEADAILHRLSEQSPLQDIDIIFNEELPK